MQRKSVGTEAIEAVAVVLMVVALVLGWSRIGGGAGLRAVPEVAAVAVVPSGE